MSILNYSKHVSPTYCNHNRPTNKQSIIYIPPQDNYIWLIHDPSTGTTAVVDPAEVAPVVEALRKTGWNLNYILNTHHHSDHTGGNQALKAKYSATVVGPAADAERIPGIDVKLSDGDVFSVGSAQLRCFDTPGHTKGHVTYYFADSKALFPG